MSGSGPASINGYPPDDLLDIFFHRMPMGIAVFDRNLILRRCNPTWAEFVTRYTRTPAGKVVAGARFLDIVPGSEETTLKRYKRALAGETVREQAVLLESNGIVSYWDVVITPLVRDGEVVGVVDVTTPATERKLAEDKLRETALQLKAIVEAFPDLHFRLGRDGTILDYSAGLTSYLYAPPQQFLGKHIQYVLPPDVGLRVEEALHRVRETGSLVSIEYSLPIQGKTLFFEARLLPLPGDQIIAIVRDITERKRAEEAVRESYRTLERRVEERTRQLTTLLEVSHNVVSTLELEPLLQVILEHLKTIVDFSGATVFSLDGDALRVLCHRGPIPQSDVSDHAFHVAGTLLDREIVLGRKPVIIPDVRADSELAREFRRTAGPRLDTTYAYVRSWMGVPLMVKDRVIGALTLDHSEVGHYQDHHAELALAFANQVAVAIDNARLYIEMHRHADELQTLLAVQQAITSHLDRDAVLQLIADEARRLTSTQRAAVLLAEGDLLRVSVVSGDAPRVLLGETVPIDRSLAGLAMRTGRAVRVDDADADPRARAEVVRRGGVRSFVSVPLLSDTQPIGAITVCDKTTGSFGPEDERVLTMLASGAVIGLENARLYGEEQERRQEAEQRRQVAEGLRDILAILNSNRPLQEMLDYVVIQAGRLLGTDTGVLYRLSPEKDLLIVQAGRGLPAEHMTHMTMPAGRGIVGRAVQTRRPVVVPDIRGMVPDGLGHDPGQARCTEWLVTTYRGAVVVPIAGRGQAYGAIVLFYPGPRELSQDELELAVSLADQAALAIENAELRTQTEQTAVAAERSRLARDLHDAVTQTLFSASLIAEVLPRLWERNPDEGRRRLEELRQLTRGALAEMRTLLLELRPATLVEVGLEDLLRQLAEATTGRARVNVCVNVEGQGRLPADVQVALYRIAQEALNNVAKHSGASRATVSLRFIPQGAGPAAAAAAGARVSDPTAPGAQAGGRAATAGAQGEGRGGVAGVELRIRDDGRGFTPGRAPSDHLGLGIMRERAEAIGARVSISTRPGFGTEVIIAWHSLQPEGHP